MPTAPDTRNPWQDYGVAPNAPNNWVGGDGSMEAAWAEPMHQYQDTFDASGKRIAGAKVYKPGYGAGADPNTVVSLGGYGGYGGTGGGGMSGSYTGGGTGAGGYSLPDPTGASAAMRALQMKSMGGLQGLLSQDTSAQRQKIQDALYETSSRGINTAADRARQTMLEGTFGRGVGSSSIGVELAGRQQQEQSDALAQAAREAFTQAGAEQRADLASALGLNQGAFNSATAGLQGEANVALANLAREQQANQFAQNLGFQGTQNDLNRAQAASQFQGQLGLNYAQLGQQNDQFGRNMGFQGEQNQLNRDQSTSENALNRQLQQMLLDSQQGFAGGQNEATRALQKYLADSQQAFQGTQNQLGRDFQSTQSQLGRDFTGSQNQLNRDFTGGQNQSGRDAAMQQLLLSLEAQDQRAQNSTVAGALGSGITGFGNLVGPLLKQWAGGTT